MEREKGVCMFDGRPTRSTATNICDGCYQIKVRMTSDLKRARAILEFLEKQEKDIQDKNLDNA